jgi:hypothetical protein
MGAPTIFQRSRPQLMDDDARPDEEAIDETDEQSLARAGSDLRNETDDDANCRDPNRRCGGSWTSHPADAEDGKEPMRTQVGHVLDHIGRCVRRFAEDMVSQPGHLFSLVGKVKAVEALDALEG